MKKTILVLIIAVVALLTAVGAGVGYFVYDFTHTRPSEVAQDVVYEVEPGKAFNTIAKDLENKGLVRNATLFSLWARFKGERSKVKVGEYLLRTNMLPEDILQTLMSGKSIARSFTVSEGLSIYEIADLYEKEKFGTAADFLALVRDPKLIQSLLGEPEESLEGYLFPETYMLTKYTDTKTLITNMVKRFLYVYNEIIPQSEIKGMSRREIVTLASIIEKETGAPEERPLISSIFHNRLNKKMKLQTDPTIIYGKAEKLGKIVINITRADLLTPTRYNTYVIDGLPPTPIANPGREALLAAIKPASTNYLFFVSKNDGTHIFSEDYKAHQKAVQSFQLNAKAREGHSWKELKKKETQPVAPKK
ncbi:endolytic transglycosylase MltG [Bdellovibrio svalbardensis]|uniref:Endolytic murein transglycosylase n=1 Tax=Bdellovibrio svalbardensis TaxID=2972972 RepID=A0ABT6DDC2_9BACT|nr:endolytic transglycosylase MltG [Bdellovibrio svalbardensis]MDG0814812.1 endolytic transglycosylase MltG [Bdellovibrio svalbardensis]